MNLNSMMTDATIDDAMKDSCFRDSVMVGCKRIDSTEFEVLAWSPRDIVLMGEDTGIDDLKLNFCSNWQIFFTAYQLSNF